MASDHVGGVGDQPPRQDSRHPRVAGEGEAYGDVPSLLCRVVEAIERGAGSIEAIVGATGLPVEKVRAVLGVLLAEGYVREARSECRCPLRRVCPFARLRRSVKTYVLVRKPTWCGSGRA